MDNPDINVIRTNDDNSVVHSLEIALPPRNTSCEVAEADPVTLPMSDATAELEELIVELRVFSEPSEDDQKRVFTKLLARIREK